MSVKLHVCITCRAGQPVSEGEPLPGARLFDALTEFGAPADVEILAVECLSACNQGCSISLSSNGRWSYVYGRMTVDDAPSILAGAAAYAATADGLVPWRDRPEIFRKQSLARIPPVTLCKEAAE